jgi:CRP/FNR family transcriptional activator FtrB
VAAVGLDLALGKNVFSTFAPEEADQLIHVSMTQRFSANVTLQEQGAVPLSLFGLLEGRVAMRMQEDGRENVVSVLGPGALFSLPAALVDLPTLTSAVTLTPSQVVIMPRMLISRLLSSNLAFCQEMLRLSARQGRAFIKMLHFYKMRTTAERLALWMIENGGNGQPFKLPYDKRTLALLLGTSPENLARAFVALESCIEKLPSSRYRVTDVQALHGIGRPSPMLFMP